MKCPEQKKAKLRKAWRDGRYAKRDMSAAGRPKGVKDSCGPRLFTAEGAKAKVENGKRLRAYNLEHNIHMGWPKGKKVCHVHRERNSAGVREAIADGRLDPAQNIRNFIKDADGTERYWKTRVNRGKHGDFYSKKNHRTMHYDCSWELARMRVLELSNEVSSYRRTPVRIPYSLNGKAHYYLPDLLICYADGTHILEEIKPVAFLKDPKNQAKFRAARAFCKSADIEFRILTSLEACEEECQ
jgi:hypothetical protein